MYFSEKVLVVRTGRFKENDLWVRFLSRSQGILTGFAFGGCRSRRRFSGCLDVLNLVLFTVSSGKRNQYLVLEEGSLINGYPELKKDSARLGMAVNSLRFVQQICPEGNDSSEIYSLILDYLEAMENNKNIPSFFPLLFRARAAFSHGYQPSLDACRRCKKHIREIERSYFLFAEGGVLCNQCRKDSDRVLQTKSESLIFLNSLGTSNPAQWTGWTPGPAILQDCFQMVESFVEYHIGKSMPPGAEQWS